MVDIEKKIAEVDDEFKSVNNVYRELVDRRTQLDKQISQAKDDLMRLQGALKVLQMLKSEEKEEEKKPS